MLNQERIDKYKAARGVTVEGLTPRQNRRILHKRRAHGHELVARCDRCKPHYIPDPEKVTKWERI
jgi:hypothetical protein